MGKLNTDLEPYCLVPNWKEAPEGTTHAEYIEPCSITEDDSSRQLWEWYKYDGTNNFFWRDGWQRDTLFGDVNFSDTVRVRPLSIELLRKLDNGSVWCDVLDKQIKIVGLANIESPRGYQVVYLRDGNLMSMCLYKFLQNYFYDSSYEENLADEAEGLAKKLCVRDGKDVDDCYDVYDRGGLDVEPHPDVEPHLDVEPHIVYVWEHYLQDAYNYLELRRELG